MFCHECIGDLAVFAECAGGADLVKAHEARVARHVSSDYGCQPASDPNWLLPLHGQAASADIMSAQSAKCCLWQVWAWGRPSSTNEPVGLPTLGRAIRP
jgi:hypothetical protein